MTYMETCVTVCESLIYFYDIVLTIVTMLYLLGMCL